MALWQSCQPPLYPWATIAFLTMAGALGAGAGAVFALVSQVTAIDQIGSVTGIVGAVGGLGGFVPPLVMGAIRGITGSYALGLALLAVVAFGGLAYSVHLARRAPAPARRPSVP